jgi:hypothetical protein
MTRYRILLPAKEELRSASRWYEEQREGLGRDLLDEFQERLDWPSINLRQAPLSGRPREVYLFAATVFDDLRGTREARRLAASRSARLHWLRRPGRRPFPPGDQMEETHRSLQFPLACSDLGANPSNDY